MKIKLKWTATAVFGSTLLPLRANFFAHADEVVDPPSAGVRIENPLGSGSSLLGLLKDLLDVIMIFAVPLIVFMIIYAGFLYVTAQGNEGQVSKAHKALLYAVIGGVLIIGAQALLVVVCGTVASFGTTPINCSTL